MTHWKYIIVISGNQEFARYVVGVTVNVLYTFVSLVLTLCKKPSHLRGGKFAVAPL